MSVVTSRERELVDRFRHLRAQAVLREEDEIVDGRIQIAHYYTGVADGLEKAIETLEEVDL